MRHAMILHTDRSDDVIRFSATVVELDGGKIRNPLDTPFQDLKVTAQANRDDETPRYYAVKLNYRDVYDADLDDLEGMVKLLRKVKRHFVKNDREHEFRWGHDLRDYLDIIEAALDIDCFLVYDGEDGSGRWGYDGSVYRRLNLDQAVEWATARLSTTV